MAVPVSPCYLCGCVKRISSISASVPISYNYLCGCPTTSFHHWFGCLIRISLLVWLSQPHPITCVTVAIESLTHPVTLPQHYPITCVAVPKDPHELYCCPYLIPLLIWLSQPNPIICMALQSNPTACMVVAIEFQHCKRKKMEKIMEKILLTQSGS